MWFYATTVYTHIHIYTHIYTYTHTYIYITVQSSYGCFPVYVCSLQRCPSLPCPGSSPRILKLVLRAGAQLGLEPRPSEANAWLFSTAGAIPKPVLGKCQMYPWGLVKYGLFTDSTPGLWRPRGRPTLGIFNQSPLVTVMETLRVHSAPGWTPAAPCHLRCSHLHSPVRTCPFPSPKKSLVHSAHAQPGSRRDTEHRASLKFGFAV